MSEMPKLRTIEQCHAWLKESDPDLPVTIGMLRKLVSEGTIPCVRNGRKILVDLNILPGAIANWATSKQEEGVTVIRAVDNSKPISAAERAASSGKYGQIRAFS